MSGEIQSNSSGSLGRTSQVDEVATLLTGGEEPTEKSEVIESEETDESNENQTDEETPSEEITEVEQEVAEDNTTWESVLGVSDKQLSFDDNGNVKGVIVKVNGESSTVPMNELIKNYQTGKAVTQKATQLAEERKKFDEISRQSMQETQTRLAHIQKMSEFLEQQLVGEFNQVNWDALRSSDPAEYAAMRQDYAVKARQIQDAQKAISEEAEKVNQETKQKHIQEYNAHIQKQREKMLENNPEWNDPDQFNKSMTDIKSFLGNQYGFTDQDFAQVSDARLIELVKDAKRYHEGKTVFQKKVQKPVPKFQKSTGKPKTVTKLERLTQAANKAKGSQKRELQSEAVAQLLLGGSK